MAAFSELPELTVAPGEMTSLVPTPWYEKALMDPTVLNLMLGLGKDFTNYGAGKSNGLVLDNSITGLQEQLAGANYLTLAQKMSKDGNYLPMMAGFLAGQFPGGKIQIDQDGYKIQSPHTSGLGSLNQPSNPGTSSVQQQSPMLQGQTPFSVNPSIPSNVQAPSRQYPTKGGLSFINPFGNGQSAINFSDLAGLGPKEVAAVIGLRMNQDEFDRQTLASLSDAIYKKVHGDSLMKGDPLDSPFIDDGSGTGNKYSMRQFEKLPSEDRSYLVFRAGGGNLSRAEWDLMQPTERVKTLQALKNNPELLDLEMKLTSAGRGSIAEDIARAVGIQSAKADVAGRDYFKSGEFTKGMEKHLADMDTQIRLSKNKDRTKAELALEWTQSQIVGKGGVIVESGWNKTGSAVIYRVYWPSTKETQDVTISMDKSKVANKSAAASGSAAKTGAKGSKQIDPTKAYKSEPSI